MNIVEIEILADKSGPAPDFSNGESWPLKGVRFSTGPHDEVTIPMTFIRRHENAAWLTVEDPVVVERPSRPNPDVDENGSPAVSMSHKLPVPGMAPPHSFLQASAFVFHTVDGDVRYRVVRNPDMYVDSDDPTAKVSMDDYESGNTRVDKHYYCVLEKGKKS